MLCGIQVEPTCNIGGSSKWRSTDTTDLQGANVVIVPDRDKPGIKHAELLNQEFPDPLWLYPLPESKAWGNLPKSKGLDLADGVDYHKITAEDIKATIGEKKVFKAAPQVAKVLTHDRFKIPRSDLGIPQLLYPTGSIYQEAKIFGLGISTVLCFK